MVRNSTAISTFRRSLFDGTYEIVSTIRGGRKSVVYKARRLADIDRGINNEFLALKVLTDKGRNFSEEEQIRREAMASLASNHANVIKVFDYVSRDDLHYIALEYAGYGDLESMLHGKPVPFTIEVSLRCIMQVLDGLSAIHRAGIIHRDIKPDNLLLSDDGLVKIADFGVALLPTDQIPHEDISRGVGTLEYLAPECLQGRPYSRLSDIYSVGVTLYHLMTKHYPYAGDTITEIVDNILHGRRIPVAPFVYGDMPANLEKFLDKVLSVDPARRFQSAGEFKQGIEDFLSGKWEDDTSDETANEGEYESVSQSETRTDLKHLQVLHEEDFSGSDKTEATLEEDIVVAAEVPTLYVPPVNKSPFRAAHFGIMGLILTIAFTTIYYFGQSEPTTPMSKNGGNVSYIGSLSALLQDGKETPFLVSQIQNGDKMLMTVGIAGWQPQVIDASDLFSGKDLHIGNHGLSLTLKHLDGDLNSETIRGSYVEHWTGKTGEWIITR